MMIMMMMLTRGKPKDCVIFYQHVLLMGKSYQKASILARQPREIQKQAYFFGKLASLACWMDWITGVCCHWRVKQMSSLLANSKFNDDQRNLFNPYNSYKEHYSIKNE